MASSLSLGFPWLLPGQVFSKHSQVGWELNQVPVESLALPLELSFATWGPDSLGRIILSSQAALQVRVQQHLWLHLSSTPPSCDSPEQLHTLSDVPKGESSAHPTAEVKSKPSAGSRKLLLDVFTYIYLPFCFLPSLW